MGNIEKGAQRANLVASLCAHLWAALGVLGVKGWVTGGALLLATLVWGVIVRATSAMPPWVLAMAAIVGACLVLRLYTELRKAWAVRGVKRLDIAALGRDCIRYHEDVLAFLVDRVDVAPSSRVGWAASRNLSPDAQNEAIDAAWERGNRHSAQTRARFIQRFSHRLIALNEMFAAANIQPIDMFALEQNSAGTAALTGAVGELLERGLLSEARALAAKGTQQYHLYLSA